MEKIYGKHKLVGLPLFLSGTPTFPVGLLLFARWESWIPVFKILVRALDTLWCRWRRAWYYSLSCPAYHLYTKETDRVPTQNPVAHQTWQVSDSSPSSTTRWVLFERKDPIQVIISLFMPKQWSFSKSLLWSTLSKALLKSITIMSVWPLSLSVSEICFACIRVAILIKALGISVFYKG